MRLWEEGRWFTFIAFFALVLDTEGCPGKDGESTGKIKSETSPVIDSSKRFSFGTDYLDDDDMAWPGPAFRKRVPIDFDDPALGIYPFRPRPRPTSTVTTTTTSRSRYYFGEIIHRTATSILSIDGLRFRVNV